MHACIHACIHAYMYTCKHANMHTCIHANKQTNERTNKQTNKLQNGRECFSATHSAIQSVSTVPAIFSVISPVFPFPLYTFVQFASVLLHPLVQVQRSSLSQWHDAIGSTLRLLTSHFHNHTYPVCACSNASVAAVGQLSSSAVWRPGLCLVVPVKRSYVFFSVSHSL